MASGNITQIGGVNTPPDAGTLTNTLTGSYGGKLADASFDPLLPNMINVDSSCGCTLTRANITGMTPDTFEQLAMVETDLARVIAGAAEAKILGVKEKGLATLLKSSLRDIKPALTTSKIDEQSIILPYIQRRQRGYQNSNYFKVIDVYSSANVGGGDVSVDASGFTGTAFTSGHNAGTPKTYEVLVQGNSWGEDQTIQGSNKVKNTYRGGPKEVDRYFLPGLSFIAYTVNAGGEAKVIDYEIVDAFNIATPGTGGSNITAAGDCILRIKERTNATAGILSGGFGQIGTNNVSDWEDWCRNQPTDFNQRIIVNWLQTSRETRCVDGVYKDTLQKILDGKVNPYAAGFKYLPLAEQNKIAAANSENAWLRSTFFGQAIGDAQTVEGYTGLPAVHDPEGGNFSGTTYPGGQPVSDGSCVLEYKANAIGIYTQLVEAARVADFAGGQLDLDQLFQLIYYLKRYRESDGDSIDVIDCMTDRYTADNLMVAFSRYYQAKYGAQVNRFVDQGQKLSFNNQVLFNYNVYDIPEIGVQLAVFHDQFFDDHLSAAKQSGGTRIGGTAMSADAKAALGRHLWFLDWSDINVGIAGTNSVTRKHPNVEAQELYKCRMEANVKEYQLKSTRWTTMVDRPQRHLVVRNFSADLPSLSALGYPLVGDGTAQDSGGTTVSLGKFNPTDWTNIP